MTVAHIDPAMTVSTDGNWMRMKEMAPRERFELPRITPAVFETAAIPGLATSAQDSPTSHAIKRLFARTRYYYFHR